MNFSPSRRRFLASTSLLLGAISFRTESIFAQISTEPTGQEAELRARVVASARAFAAVEWSPSQDIPYWNPKYGFFFKKDEKYLGIPYTQRNRNNDLASFEKNLRTIDGVRYYVGPSESTTYCGNDCSSMVSFLWREIDPELPILWTGAALPTRAGKIVAVGDYPFDSAPTTPKIVENAGGETMTTAFSRLRPGDAVLYSAGSSGHIMLVLKNEPEKERLYIADQTGLNDEGRLKGQNGRSTMRVDCEYSYRKLVENGYLPIALKALVDAAK